MKNSLKGFTLVELMVVVVIVAIFAAIAIPSYQEYARRVQAKQTEQEMQRLASELERWKSRNFNYLGFNLNPQNLHASYSIEIKDGADTSKNLDSDGAVGQSWVIRALTTNEKNFNYLLTSAGIKCKNKTKNNVSYTGCGTGSVSWESR